MRKLANKKDNRVLRPLLKIHETATNKTFILEQLEHLKLEGKDIYFTKHNNISSFINIASKEMSKAQNIYTKMIMPLLEKKSKINFRGSKLTQLYDYFEHIQSAII